MNKPMGAVFDDLEGKHVLITGGAGGIGEGLTRAFAGQGCRVSVLDKDEKSGRALANECTTAGAKVGFYPVELTDADSLTALLGDIVGQKGPVNVLVNNAGWDPRYDVLKMSHEEWDSLFKLNVGHYFTTCRELIPAMKEAGGGSIIMTTSVIIDLAWKELTCYAATKMAIVGMVRSLARAVGQDNIRVNGVAPGWVMTERQIKELCPPKVQARVRNEYQILPLLITPQNLAPTYLFLASRASQPITSQILTVDAGLGHFTQPD